MTAEENFLLESRHRRITKTVRLDERLLRLIPKDQGISDVLNLSLLKFLKERNLLEGFEKEHITS